MRSTEFGIWSLALLLSVGVHALLFRHAELMLGDDEREQIARQQTTRVSFRSVSAPQPTAVPQQFPEEEPAPEQETAARPQALEKQVPVPEKAEPREKKKIEEASSQPMPAEAKPSHPTVESKLAPAEQASLSRDDSEALQAQARREYLAVLMAHIERYKFYPRAARRRGLEGEVVVSFTLQADGRISGLQTNGGHRLLNRAAREALEAAQPLPEPPATMVLPSELTFAIRYQLR